MENEISFQARGARNIGPRKIETKMRTGATLHRPALGDIQNRPFMREKNNVPIKKVSQNIFTKKGLLPKNETKDFVKENLPVQLPSTLKICENVHETMDVEMEDSGELMQVDDRAIAFSSHVLNIKDIDRDDAKNPQLVSEYVKDIYKYLWELEGQHKVKANFLEGQKITSRMRSILIDWLVQVHQRFNLLQETLFLSVAILDRFLQIDRTINKDRLQLVGVTALFIACKYEEMYIDEIADFAHITDKAFTKKDIRVMEVHMLTTLNFYISFPLHLHFLRRNSKAGQVDSVHHTLAKYLMELTLPEYSFSHYKASLVAAASLYLSMQIIGNGTEWNDLMAHYSNYSKEQIISVVYKLSALVIKSSTCKQQAIRTKYKASKFMRISDLDGLKPTSRLLKNNAEKASFSC